MTCLPTTRNTPAGQNRPRLIKAGSPPKEADAEPNARWPLSCLLGAHHFGRTGPRGPAKRGSGGVIIPLVMQPFWSLWWPFGAQLQYYRGGLVLASPLEAWQPHQLWELPWRARGPLASGQFFFVEKERGTEQLKIECCIKRRDPTYVTRSVNAGAQAERGLLFLMEPPDARCNTGSAMLRIKDADLLLLDSTRGARFFGCHF